MTIKCVPEPVAVGASPVVHAARGRGERTKSRVIAQGRAGGAHEAGMAECGGRSHVIQRMVIWRVWRSACAKVSACSIDEAIQLTAFAE